MHTDSHLTLLGGEGPPVVLIHGYGADSFTWLATTPPLLQLSSVWLMDLPGHGKGGRASSDGSLPTLITQVRNSLRAAGLSEVHVIGHSLGARIAMELASQDPERVKSLFLISPAGVGASINSDFLSSFHQAADEEAVVALLSQLVHDPRMISRSLAGRVLDYLEQDRTRGNLERMVSGLESAQSEVASTIISLQKSGIPCSHVWGLEDQINPPDKTCIDTLPGDSHLLNSCGHLPHLEHSASVNRLLRDFYRSIGF